VSTALSVMVVLLLLLWRVMRSNYLKRGIDLAKQLHRYPPSCSFQKATSKAAMRIRHVCRMPVNGLLDIDSNSQHSSHQLESQLLFTHYWHCHHSQHMQNCDDRTFSPFCLHGL
jgi:hypothetical protein